MAPRDAGPRESAAFRAAGGHCCVVQELVAARVAALPGSSGTGET